MVTSNELKGVQCSPYSREKYMVDLLSGKRDFVRDLQIFVRDFFFSLHEDFFLYFESFKDFERTAYIFCGFYNIVTFLLNCLKISRF